MKLKDGRYIKKFLGTIVKNTVKSLFGVDCEIYFEETPHIEFGDYSTNFLFKLSKITHKSPKEIGDTISLELFKTLKSVAREVNTQAGFLNITLSNKILHDTLRQINSDPKNYGKQVTGLKNKVNIEFVSANPTGPLNVVNARAAAIGDSLKRILNFMGYDADSEFYSNNAGAQIKALVETVKWWMDKANGTNRPFPETGYRGKYLEAVAKSAISEHVSENELEDYVTEKILNEQLKVLKKFGVKFNNVVNEKWIRNSEYPGLVLRKLKEEKFLFFEDGATFFRSTDFGDTEPRVIIRRNGTGTYFFYDLAYHLYKLDRKYKWLINLLGPDHHGYLKRMEAGLSALGYDGKLQILIVQQVNLLKGNEKIKMSKREGQYYTLHDLLKEVGKDAARFFFLMRTLNSHLNFDMDRAKLLDKNNPVYYVQYAHARACSLLKFGEEKGFSPSDKSLRLLQLQEERALMRKLVYFPDTVEYAAVRLEPHEIAKYLMELSDIFHNYYQKNRVVDESKPELTQARLFLVLGVKNVLKAALSLIGVSQPKSM